MPTLNNTANTAASYWLPNNVNAFSYDFSKNGCCCWKKKEVLLPIFALGNALDSSMA
jgi:hypothetical protein